MQQTILDEQQESFLLWDQESFHLCNAYISGIAFFTAPSPIQMFHSLQWDIESIES